MHMLKRMATPGPASVAGGERGPQMLPRDFLKSCKAGCGGGEKSLWGSAGLGLAGLGLQHASGEPRASHGRFRLPRALPRPPPPL